jgi:Fur family transcriptional regulator, ferric uptake regulator
VSCETDTASVLRASGQKVTPQRLIILSALRHAGGHVTAAQLLEVARKAYPYVDASTVYRTLSAARDLRLVSETNMGGGDTLYEWLGSHRHHHLICRRCGQVSSLDEEHLDVLSATLERETGFQADLDHIAIFGTCAACVRQEQGTGK